MDRDDVIKRLEQVEQACQLVLSSGGHYNLINDQDASYVAYAIHDAIALLQKEKAVKPNWRLGKAYCGCCDNKLPQKKYNIDFCGKCGHRIDWSDDLWQF